MEKTWKDFKIQKITPKDKLFPNSLKKAKPKIKEIYFRGELTKEKIKKTLAIVGPRAHTRYGAEVVAKFAPHLVAEAYTIVSGFMYGIDTLAHTETLKSGGITIAVLGSGLDQYYPIENERLYTKILQNNGVVMSEYKPQTKPKTYMFVQRNRIVAALANKGTLVIEAGKKSGSLITAKYAKKYSQKVYAVPGPITSIASEGTNNLIRVGEARVALSPTDITNKHDKVSPTKQIVAENKIQKLIIKNLRVEDMSVDELSLATGETIVSLSNELSLMSLKGKISEVGGRYHLA